MGSPEVRDLGDGKTTFSAGGETFSLSVIDFQAWYSEQTFPEGKPYAALRAVQDRVREECGVSLNMTQADALLHEMTEYVYALKKKRDGRLS